MTRSLEDRETLASAARIKAEEHAARKAARPPRQKREPRVVGEPGEQTERRVVRAEWRVTIKARQRFRCTCGADLIYSVGAAYDHIVPIALGGAHSLDNLQALCGPCHTLKTKADVKAIAKAKRIARKHFEGPRKAKRPIRSRGFQ